MTGSVSAEQYKRTERGTMVEEERRGFRIHAAVYAVVIAVLTAVNVLLVPEYHKGRCCGA